MFKIIEDLERLLGMKPESDVSAASPHHWFDFHRYLELAMEKAKHIAILTGQMPDPTAHAVSQPEPAAPAPEPASVPPAMDMPTSVDEPPVPVDPPSDQQPMDEPKPADIDHDAESK